MSLLDKTNLLITANAVKAGKLYSVIPANGTGDCTVVRNTTATKVNSSSLIENVVANVPRINYDSAGANPSVLVEPQRTNLIAFSEDFNNTSVWVKSNILVNNNQGTSPSGSINLNSLTTTAINSSQSRLTSFVSTIVNQPYTLSCFVKFTNTPTTQIYLAITGVVRIYLNSDGTFTSITNTGAISVNVFNFGNGFFRISVSLVASSTTSSHFVGFAKNGSETFTTSGGDRFLIWGGQIEQATGVSSYIPTSGAAVTRNSDVITVSPPTGTVKITTTFSDNTTQVITSIPATFTVPNGLIKQVLMQSSL